MSISSYFLFIYCVERSRLRNKTVRCLCRSGLRFGCRRFERHCRWFATYRIGILQHHSLGGSTVIKQTAGRVSALYTRWS